MRRRVKKKRIVKQKLRGIHYNVKIDRFYNADTGRFIDNITGLLSSAARRERRAADRSGFREEWKENLSKRKRKPPPKTPHEHERLEFETTAQDIDDYLDSIIYRNLDYMDEE